MSINSFTLLRNVGQYDNVSAGAQIPLTKFSLVYAENGRGKTTIAAILRSLSTGEPKLINERKRLGAQHDPHIVLDCSGGQVSFQNGAWTAPKPDINIFDDAFVSANVCSGIEIETAHRQNLHELILGAQGVALNGVLQGHVTKIEEHNRKLRAKESAIPASSLGPFTVAKFCDLKPDADIEKKVKEAEQRLSAAQSADAIRQRAEFRSLALPNFDPDEIERVLASDLPGLEAAAAAQVQAHLRKIGRGSEAWIAEGMPRISEASKEADREVCPFCVQDLQGSPMIAHYQSYFSKAYANLKTTINETGKGINQVHGGDVPTAFERSIREAIQNCAFWKGFTEIPEVEIDTAAISRTWTAAREAVLTVLRSKAAAPLEPLSLSEDARAAISAYEVEQKEIQKISSSLQDANKRIAVVKEQAASANVPVLNSDLEKLKAQKVRYEPTMVPLCDDCIAEKAAKKATEALRAQAREALDTYRQTIFPTYETAINAYLARFNAGFRLSSVTSVNNRAGSSASYSVLINEQSVSLTSEDGPSFRTALSAGDRNTLALAFFFASLELDPNRAQQIVVIDDPMTSLDEHRSLATVQQIKVLYGLANQVIVLSHSKPFLCALWQNADAAIRSALRIGRANSGSNLSIWNVNDDCITEHDHRYALVTDYLAAGDPTVERSVAAALRPILEAFMRVAYPSVFPPGMLLGQFIGLCRQRHGGGSEILSVADADELRALLDYANLFHHDTNSAWQTEAINDAELVNFASRTLLFASRG